MANQVSSQPDSFARLLIIRFLSSLGCAALAAGLGGLQPVVWYQVWSAMYPGLFGQEYQELLPALLATLGVVGGGIIGLLAGAVAPSRVGLAASFAGLGLLQIAAGLYFLTSPYAPYATVVAFLSILVPSVIVDFASASACWFMGRKRPRG
jgi:hypothetical protein